MVFGLNLGFTSQKGSKTEDYKKSGSSQGTYGSSVVAPDYWLNQYQDTLGGVNNFQEGLGALGQNMSAYGQDISHINNTYLTDAANKNANTLAGMDANYGGAYAAPEDLIANPIEAQQISAQTGANFMDTYKNPYLDDVLGTSLADFDTGVDRGANAFRAGSVGGGQGGNSRQGVAAGVLAGEAARGRGSLSAGIRSNAFDTAAGYGMMDANRDLTANQSNQASSLNASLANQRDAYNVGTFNNSLLDSRQKFDSIAADNAQAARMNAVGAMTNNIFGIGDMNLSQSGLDALGAQYGLDALALGTSLFGEEGFANEQYDENGNIKTKTKGSGFSASGRFSSGE